jgi:hypothetical protein
MVERRRVAAVPGDRHRPWLAAPPPCLFLERSGEREREGKGRDGEKEERGRFSYGVGGTKDS